MKQKTKEKIGTYYIYFPTKIIHIVNNIKVSKSKKDKMYKFLEFLKKSSERLGESTETDGIPNSITNYVSVHHTYFTRNFGGRYKEFLNDLIREGVIEVNNSYSNYVGKEKCKEYRISPKMTGDIITIDSVDRVEISKNLLNNTHIQSYFLRCESNNSKDNLLGHITSVFKEVDEMLKNKYILYSKEDVGLEYIPFINKKGEYYKVKTEDYFSKNDYVIKDKNKYFSLDKDKFLKNKEISVKLNLIESVKRLVNEDLYAKRNETNNRLDTNFTNMSSIIFERYKSDNDMVELDVSNNQFAILSYILPKDLKADDVDIFKEQAELGTLYEYVQKELKLRSRECAKELLICVLFASYRVLDKRVKGLFPNLCEWIKDWKKENGDDGAFPIMLQKKESEIFIDGLMKKVKLRGYCCFTRHDSIVVSKNNELAVRKIMEDYFREINYKCKIK